MDEVQNSKHSQANEGEASPLRSLLETAPQYEHSAKIAVLVQALDEFRKIDSKMPVAQIMAFLLIANDCDMGMQDFASVAEMRDSTSSRYLVNLANSRTEGDGALGLVERGLDPTNPRRARYTLSQKGKELVARLVP